MIRKFTVAVVALLLLACFSASAMAEGKSAIMVIPMKDFEDTEYKKTRAALEDAGIVVKVTSLKEGKARGQRGTRAAVDMVLEQVNVEDFDAVVFIGGKGSKSFVNERKAQRIAKDAFARDRLVGAICYSPVLLAKADVVRDRRVTVADAWGSRGYLQKAGVASVSTSKSVIVDGRLITANGPRASAKFGAALVEALQ